MKAFGVLLGILLASSVAMRASIINDPTHFTIFLSGFDDSVTFSAVANDPNHFLDSSYSVGCVSDNCFDPTIEIDLGGSLRTITDTSFSFTNADSGNGMINDTGQHWDHIFIQISGPNFDVNQFFTCGGTAFLFPAEGQTATCGFRVDPDNPNVIDAVFEGTPGIDSLPEPGTLSLLLGALALCAVVQTKRAALRR